MPRRIELVSLDFRDMTGEVVPYKDRKSEEEKYRAMNVKTHLT